MDLTAWAKSLTASKVLEAEGCGARDGTAFGTDPSLLQAMQGKATLRMMC